MKTISTLLLSILFSNLLVAQPVLDSMNIILGSTFNIYSLSNVNTGNIANNGADATWDLSSSTATLAGTAELLAMSATPYELQYPEANFAIKITPTGSTAMYSLFNLTASILEEVANNVGSPSPVSFTNARTALVFPFTFTLLDSDTYQKSGQGQKTTTNHYDSYGTFMANGVTVTNVVRNEIIDDGNTSYNFWTSSPVAPLFQASSNGYIFWQSTSSVGVMENSSNALFDVYPNPATNQLTIVNKAKISLIEIYNIEGMLELSTQKSVIDVSGLAAGVYFIRAHSEGGTVSQQFVKD
jgi:hypothetical protein